MLKSFCQCANRQLISFQKVDLRWHPHSSCQNVNNRKQFTWQQHTRDRQLTASRSIPLFPTNYYAIMRWYAHSSKAPALQPFQIQSFRRKQHLRWKCAIQEFFSGYTLPGNNNKRYTLDAYILHNSYSAIDPILLFHPHTQKRLCRKKWKTEQTHLIAHHDNYFVPVTSTKEIWMGISPYV